MRVSTRVDRSVMQDFREKYCYILEANVEWADMDAFGHVNNTIYFRYFERVRIALLEECHYREFMLENHTGPILASTQCRFKAPMTYPDTCLIGTSISKLEEDRLLMSYAIYSHKLGRVTAEGDGLLVYYDYEKSEKTKIPDGLRQRLLKFMRA